MRGINIQKYSNVILEECVVSHVGFLCLSGFDEISAAVFEAGTSLAEKAEQKRKRLQTVYVPMLRVLCLYNWQGKHVSGSRNEDRERERERERELSLEIKMCVCVCVREIEGECAVSVSQNGKNDFLEDKSIYTQSLSCSRLQMRGTKSKIRSSCEHKSCDFPDQ